MCFNLNVSNKLANDGITGGAGSSGDGNRRFRFGLWPEEEQPDLVCDGPHQRIARADISFRGCCQCGTFDRSTLITFPHLANRRLLSAQNATRLTGPQDDRKDVGWSGGVQNTAGKTLNCCLNGCALWSSQLEEGSGVEPADSLRSNLMPDLSKEAYRLKKLSTYYTQSRFPDQL